jgi:hypothetical protein
MCAPQIPRSCCGVSSEFVALTAPLRKAVELKCEAGDGGLSAERRRSEYVGGKEGEKCGRRRRGRSKKDEKTTGKKEKRCRRRRRSKKGEKTTGKKEKRCRRRRRKRRRRQGGKRRRGAGGEKRREDREEGEEVEEKQWILCCTASPTATGAQRRVMSQCEAQVSTARPHEKRQCKTVAHLKTKLHGLRQSSSELSAKLVSTIADRRCHVVSVTDPHSRILSF